MTRPDPAADLAAVAAATALPGQPAPLFAALDRAMGASIGHRLFTILIADRAAGYSQRVYSNMPEAYPVGGLKPIRDTPWSARLFDAGECHIGRNYEELQAIFLDHALIRSLGCESVLNVPVRWDGGSIGTINLLHRAAHYDEADVAPARSFAALAVPALLAARGRHTA